MGATEIERVGFPVPIHVAKMGRKRKLVLELWSG
jgi:hypothetical protein